MRILTFTFRIFIAVAELGGYLGMTLGVSLLDMEHLMQKIAKYCRSENGNSGNTGNTGNSKYQGKVFTA